MIDNIVENFFVKKGKDIGVRINQKAKYAIRKMTNGEKAQLFMKLYETKNKEYFNYNLCSPCSVNKDNTGDEYCARAVTVLEELFGARFNDLPFVMYYNHRFRVDLRILKETSEKIALDYFIDKLYKESNTR